MKPIQIALAISALTFSACHNPKDPGSDLAPDCENEAVIMVVAGPTLDRARMGQYAKALADSGLYPDVKGYYLNSPQPVAVFEGNIPDNFVTLMVRFPSLDAARKFWDSDEYQNKIKPLRLNPSAGDYFVTVYQEADLPTYMKGQVGSAAYKCD